MSEIGEPAPTRPEKSASAFRTIGEVAGVLDLPAHVLRFWESKFSQLKPLKRGGGRRYYRPEDVLLLHRIRQCLYQEGYTIRGVQKLLGEPPGDSLPAPARDPAAMPSLFPLDAAADPAAPPPESPDAPPTPQEPARRPRRRSPKPDNRAALEDIRRELLEARALLDELRHRSKAP